MQTNHLPLWAKCAGYFFGIGLLFIGIRFLIMPEVAERGFGLFYNQPNEAFHYIKGSRDAFSGLILVIFTALQWRKPLAVVALAGALVPVVDMLTVLTTPAVPGAAWIHGPTAVALLIFSYFLLRTQTAPSHALPA
jgi:hypothetical protein